MAKIIDVERALVTLCAELLGIEEDKDIFRGKLPAAKTDCIAVTIESPGRGNEPVMTNYATQLLGRYESRDDALEMCDKFDKHFPHIGHGFYILKTGKPAMYGSTAKGKDVHHVTLNLHVRLTKPLEVTKPNQQED